MKVSDDMGARASKTLVAGEPMREPSWLVWTLMKGSRVVVLTVLWTGLGMGVGLLFGITGLAAASVFTGRTPDMSIAYRTISIPLAICSGGFALLWNLLRAVQAAGAKLKAREGVRLPGGEGAGYTK